jgi:acetolactate synthase-1/2/3 large subunit
VVVALPEDMLSSEADVADRPAMTKSSGHVTDADAQAIMEILHNASAPLVIAGGSDWSQTAAHDLAHFCEAFDLPVACAFRRQDFMDNRHPNYIGDLGVGMNPNLATRLKNADCLLVLGSRLGDSVTGGYTLLDPAQTGKTIVHIHPDPDELGRVYHADLSIVATGAQAVGVLAQTKMSLATPWAQWASDARAEYEAFQQPVETMGDVKLEQIVKHLTNALPEDAIVTNGAGNYATWLHRYFCFKQYGTQLAPTSGSMGYGFPAAIAASLEHPDKTIVAWLGDGEFQMTLNELSTAIQHQAKPIVIIVNNGRYGTIRMHQERSYPSRVSGTDLFNPDFAALARSYGGHGEKITDGADFAQAFERAQNADTLAVIELVTDPQVITPSLSLYDLKK